VRRGRPACAVVSIAALDVRRRPEHRSELGSQLLLGEVVRIVSTSRDGLWSRVENVADGYRGWARNWGLITASAARAGRWRTRATARVTSGLVEATARPGGGPLVTPLFLNSRLIPEGRPAAGQRRLELPDGRRAWVPVGAVVIGARPGVDIATRIRGLLGVPYIWGGRTSAGFDCSGFTQQVLAEQGVALPRDAWQQFRGSNALRNGEPPEIGDLIFFGNPGERPSHVGIALGAGYYAHARGRVMIGSLDPRNPLCDRQLLDQLIAVRRPAAGHFGSPKARPRGRRAT
jgi:gamma-D-glutamyl-L-lysine dipeptidyl-peptidase